MLNQSDLEYLRAFIQRNSAIVLDQDKTYLIETRLDPLVREMGLSSLQELVFVLRTGESSIQQRVTEAMVTHETSFFRDIHPFDALRTKILPELIERCPSGEGLNVWCAASSSGQEPFSLAMLLREHFPAFCAEGRVRIIATDLSTAILARAREGLYDQIEVNRGLPATLFAKYFTKEGLQWRIKPEVRRMVEFHQCNLATGWTPQAPLDLILLRNVLIYFGTDTKKSILSRVRSVLSPHGYLLMGSSETTLNLDLAFETVAIGKTLCYKLRQEKVR